MAESGLPISKLLESSDTLGSAVSVLAPAAGLLERIYYDDLSVAVDDDRASVWLSLILDGQAGFDLPGGFAIRVGEGDGVTPLTLGLRVSSAGVALAVEELAVVLAIPNSLLRPAPPEGGGTAPEQVELVLRGGLLLDESRRLRVEGFESVSLPRSFVGGSEVVVSATDVAIDTAHGLLLGEARIELPEGLPQLAPEELVLTNAVIGPSGVSGRLEAQYTPEFDAEAKRFVGPGSGELGGVPFAFTAIAIELRDNDLVEASLAGQLLLPFFDQPTGVTITLHSHGSFSVDIGGGTTLATIEREKLLRLTVGHIGFEVLDGRLLIHTGGTVTLLVGDEEWPTFRADDISIDADGDITVHGVGLMLRDGKPLDLGASPAGIGRVPGITIDKLDLSGNPLDDGLIADAELSTSIELGPFTATLQRVGVHARLAARLSGGGAVVGDLSFRPPATIAIGVDGEQVSGGGVISRNPVVDAQKVEYSGLLELKIAERIAVKGMGLLTPMMPDGGKGYSFVVIIFTEGFAPIPLGLGFTLTGIGGLLAINRTFAEEALRAGLKNHTLDSVLFPQDPLRNAPQIISNLNTVFPPADGHHLFGPMVQITWGTPPLITADLGLVLEFGARQRLLVLGQVVAILPRRDHDLLRLQMDAVGVLDFDQGTVALDATLYDSRLLRRFPLTGDMAMRNLVLAVGGLHPAFRPPPKFPKLARLALDLSRGDNPRLRCEAYFALTPNTVQFGARAELYAAAIGFSIHGEIGIDVLIQLAPFHFLADFYAQVQLKRGSTNLFKVRVEGTLEGPLPLHIKGKATFEILWWDVTVRFNATLVGGVTPLLAELIDVLPLLSAALVHPGNWRSQLPTGQRPMVTLRAMPGAATDVCLHPLGTLTVTQSVVPLNLEISRFGAAVPAGARSFTISSVSLGSLGGQHQTPPSVTDFFAPAQFFEMSDAEKLSSPSFEPMVAGFSIASDAFVFSENPDDWLKVDKIAYDTITVDTQTNELRPLRRSEPNELYVLSPELLGKQARFGAAGSSALRRTGSAKYRTTRGRYELVPEGWIIVPTEDLPARPAPGSAAGTLMTYSEAVQALRQLQQEDPAKAAGLKILRLSELPSSE